LQNPAAQGITYNRKQYFRENGVAVAPRDILERPGAKTMKGTNYGRMNRGILERDQYLEQLVQLLVNCYKPVKIYLFGSKARGDSGPDSDYDVMVIVRKRISPLKKKKFHNARWDAGLTVASDIILVTQKYFEERIQLKCSLPATVAEEGKLLYDAA
jgi:uncharacterized protein